MLLEKIIAQLAPDDCLICYKEGSIVCEGCFLTEFVEPLSGCYRCGAVDASSSTCRTCRRQSPLTHVWRATKYQGLSRKLVQRYKFSSQRSASTVMVTAMLAVLPTFDAVVCAVPTASRRVRERGFDHALRLASSIARQRDLRLISPLLRSIQAQQVGAGRLQRLKQVKGGFLIIHPEQVKGRNVLLVDDVMTTGASLEECARVLRRAGAKRVDALVFAH